MYRYLIFFFSLLYIYNIYAVKYEVNFDGSADFISIQSAINISTDGDTILVHQGEYFENCIIEAKNIYLISNSYYDNNLSPNETIVDGNNSSSCFYILNSEVLIHGFKITNGIGYNMVNPPANEFRYGGGIYSDLSLLSISNCIITDNKAQLGGGLLLGESNISLIESTISNNDCNFYGGGIFAYESNINFHPVKLSNVYCNNSIFGADIYYFNGLDYLNVIVDTFTVDYKSTYNIVNLNSEGNDVLLDYDLSLLNSTLSPLENDLYVSPYGDNSNSGLTQQDPLKNIYYALSVIKADSLHHRTIHLMDGVYSPYTNNELFPIQLKGFVSLKGGNKQNCIIDASYTNYHFADLASLKGYTIENLTMMNGNGIQITNGGMGSMIIRSDYRKSSELSLKNLNISNNTSYQNLISLGAVDVICSDITLENNDAVRLAVFTSDHYDPNKILIDRVKIINNNAACLSIVGSIIEGNKAHATISNSLFANNTGTPNGFTVSGVCLNLADSATLEFYNNTIINNTWNHPDGSAVFCHYNDINLNISNSIFYGNSPRELKIIGGTSTYPNFIEIVDTIIDEGTENIYVSGLNNITYDNVLNINPDLINYGFGDYYPSDNSPCIDQGRINLPNDLSITEFDLLLNPRLYGDNVDIGAYEWNGASNGNINNIDNYNLKTYPNPLKITETRFTMFLSFNNPYKDKIVISLFNIRGQKIKTVKEDIFEKGEHSLELNVKTIPTGVYFIKFETTKGIIYRKVIVIK